MPVTQLTNAKALETWDHEHIIHPQLPRGSDVPPVIMVDASGVYVRDVNGRQYLDATGSGVWCGQVGHGRRELADVGRDQLSGWNSFARFGITPTNQPSVCLSD